MKAPQKHSRLIVFLHFCTLSILVIAIVAFVKSSSNSVPYIENKGSRIGVTGFTNLNKWSMDTDTLNCNADFVISDRELKEINNLTFSTPIKNLKSTHAYMDTVVYKMLATETVKDITFKQTNIMILPRMKMVNIIGDLTIGKVTKKIDLQMVYDVKNDNEVSFIGLKKLDLNFFEITRKNSILNNIKFDNQVLVQLEINLNNKTGIKRKRAI